MMSALTRRLYVTAWFALGAIALGYFLFLFQSVRTPGNEVAESSIFSRSPLSSSDPTVDDPALSQAIARMSSEIESLKSALEAARKENAALTAHVRTLESAFGPTTAALPPQTKAPERSSLKDENDKSADQAPKVQITMMPMPADGFSNEFEKAPLPIAGPTKPMHTLFAVEVATGLKGDRVQSRWREIEQKYAKHLAGLQPRKVRSTQESSGNPTYRLVVGPFRNAAAAALMCARLSLTGLDCSGTVYGGDPIGEVANR